MSGSRSGPPQGPALAADCIVFDAEDRLLLIRRKYEPFKGLHALPGGFVELGETVDTAARRELQEETSLQAGALRLIGVYSDPRRDPRRHTASAAFLVLDFSGALNAGDDAAAADFVMDWQNERLAFDHDQIVRDALALRGNPLPAAKPAHAETGPISPMFVSSDVARSLAFYCDALGFHAVHREPGRNPFFAMLVRDATQLFLKSQDGVTPMPNPARHLSLKWDAYVYTPDPDSLAAEFAGRAVAFRTSVADTSEGLRGFEIADPDGYVLFFGRPR
jgi:8-oxo-dGTP diphosphatase